MSGERPLAAAAANGRLREAGKRGGAGSATAEQKRNALFGSAFAPERRIFQWLNFNGIAEIFYLPRRSATPLLHAPFVFILISITRDKVKPLRANML